MAALDCKPKPGPISIARTADRQSRSACCRLTCDHFAILTDTNVHFVLVRVDICPQDDTVPLVSFRCSGLVMVQFLWSLSLTNVLPVSLIVPVI